MGVSCLFSQVISNIMRGNSVKDSLVWTSIFFFLWKGSQAWEQTVHSSGGEHHPWRDLKDM